MKKLKCKYSGDESVEFWNRVNSLPDAEQQEMYLAGVLLQDMEEKILKILNEYLEENKK